MKEFLIYLFKSGLCLSIFVLVYRLLLRPTTFFRLNRVFLLSGLCISLLIPLVVCTYDVITVSAPTVTPINEGDLYTSPTLSKVSEVDVDYSGETPNVTTKEKNTLMIKLTPFWSVLFGAYITVVFLLIVRNVIVHKDLLAIIKQGKKTRYEGYKVIDTPAINTPFAVLNTIFADMKKISEDKVKSAILKHETIHIKQRHWIDLIFNELVLTLQWFNPVMWLYTRSLKENHEFLADKGVIEQGISPEVYRAVLINERLQGKAFNLASPFKSFGTLGRLAMIKKEKTSPWKRVLALGVIPLLGIFLWISAEPNYLFINLDNFSVHTIAKVMTVDKDGYPVEGGVSAKNLLFLSKMASYEGAIPSSLRTKKIDLYAKQGKEGTLVISVKEGSSSITNTELLHRVKTLNDVIILIDGKASSEEDLANLNTQDISSLSYLVNDKMLVVEGDIITVSLVSETKKNYPKLLKTDNLEFALSEDITSALSLLKNPKVILKGKPSNMNELKNTQFASMNVMTVFTKQNNIKKYAEKTNSSVILVK